MTSYEKYAQIRDSKGLTDYKVAKATGNGTATFTNWKKGIYTPKQDKIEAIAAFLGVKPEEIVERPASKIKVPRLKELSPELSEAIESDLQDIVKSITDKAIKELSFDPETFVFSQLISKLNDEGKVKVYGYLQDLLLIDKYTKRIPKEQEDRADTSGSVYEQTIGIQPGQEDNVSKEIENVG